MVSPGCGGRARSHSWAFWRRAASGSHRATKKQLCQRVRWDGASR
jgi:hypothetical protein